ncbi:MAG TPA: flagellar protein FlaG [Paucimonas sp.]|nr:flagellar protein FlaG [Paucimonas sp.]
MDIRPPTTVAHPATNYNDKPIPVGQASAKPVVEPIQPDVALQPTKPVPTASQLADMLKDINKAVQALSQNVEFSIDEDTDRAIVKVVDKETKEVIRQMPSKEVLEIAKALDRVQGLLIKQKA